MTSPAAERAPSLDDAVLTQLEDDPYPVYARLRREQPTVYLPPVRVWMVTRWEDCERIGSDESLAGPTDFTVPFFGPNVMAATGELHRWWRSGIDPPLRPKAVQGYIYEQGRSLCTDYVAEIRPRGRADATVELLERISVRAIGNVLGYNEIDDDTLQRWFHDLSNGSTNFGEDPEVAALGDKAKAEVDGYTRTRIEELTASPDDSGLSHMIHTGIGDGPPRTFEDLQGTIRVIILGGFQEPGHGAAASLLGLLQDPAQLAAAKDDPATYVSKAVVEGLRWISPFNVTERKALVDIEVGDVTIPAGDDLMLMIGSANRDEERFEDPDRFDLNRPRQSHAAFGYGAHLCSGHFISRRLEEIMLEEILVGLPGLRLDPDTPPTVSGFMMRGVKTCQSCGTRRAKADAGSREEQGDRRQIPEVGLRRGSARGRG